MNFEDLPTFNAVVNATTTILLVFGYIQIRRGNRGLHKKVMLSAFGLSVVFLISYSIYHFQVGSVPYPYHDWTRLLYFSILIPHIILATLLIPSVLVVLWNAIRENFEIHKRLARWVWPMWLFVSITGVLVYFMLYRR